MPVNARTLKAGAAAGLGAAVIVLLVMNFTDYDPRDLDDMSLAGYVGVKALLGVVVASYVV